MSEYKPPHDLPIIYPDTRDALKDLGRAIRDGDTATVRRLVASDTSNLSVSRKQYLMNGLVTAIYSDQVEQARYLLNNGADIQDKEVTAAARLGGSLKIFELLIEKGWDINTLDTHGDPVLLYVLSYFLFLHREPSQASAD